MPKPYRDFAVVSRLSKNRWWWYRRMPLQCRGSVTQRSSDTSVPNPPRLIAVSFSVITSIKPGIRFLQAKEVFQVPQSQQVYNNLWSALLGIPCRPMISRTCRRSPSASSWPLSYSCWESITLIFEVDWWLRLKVNCWFINIYKEAHYDCLLTEA